jgi:hypothetical protein
MPRLTTNRKRRFGALAFSFSASASFFWRFFYAGAFAPLVFRA